VRRRLNAALAIVTRLLAVIAICIGLLPSGAESCTCRGWNLPEDEQIRNEVEWSKYVVLARVTAIEVSTPSAEGTVRVTGVFQSIERFKGDDLGTIPMKDEYRDGAYASSCGEGLPKLSVGAVVLLYLQKPAVDEWTFSDCSRSRVLQTPNDDSEVAKLRSMGLRSDG
jgi:hypothetical protein